MNKKLFVLLLFSLFYSLANAFEFNFENAPFAGNLEFNEKDKKAGVREAVVAFYNVEEKFGEIKESPATKLVCRYDDNDKIFEMVEYEIRTRYNETQMRYLITDETFKHRSRYMYGDKGNIIEIKTTDLAKGEPSFWTYKYNKKGELLEKIPIMVDRGADSLFDLRKYKYNEKGKLISEVGFDSDGEKTDDIEYLSDNSGNLIKKIFYSVGYEQFTREKLEAHAKRIESYKYDAKGRRIELTHGETGDRATIRYEYNDKGNVVKERCYAQNPGDPIPRDLSEPSFYHILDVIYRYDENGNKTEVEKILYETERGTLGRKLRPSGEEKVADTVILKYKYDDKGNVVEGRSYWKGALCGLFRCEYNPHKSPFSKDPKLGVIYIGMSREDLERAGYNKRLQRRQSYGGGGGESITFVNWVSEEPNDMITVYLIDGKVKEWEVEKH